MNGNFDFRYQLSTMAKERLDPTEIGIMIKAIKQGPREH